MSGITSESSFSSFVSSEVISGITSESSSSFVSSEVVSGEIVCLSRRDESELLSFFFCIISLGKAY